MECSNWYSMVFCIVGLLALVALFTIGLVKLCGWVIKINEAIVLASRADKTSGKIDYKLFWGCDCIASRVSSAWRTIERHEDKIAEIEGRLPKPRKPKPEKE